MQPNLTQQANDAATQGQQMLNEDVANRDKYSAQYGDFVGQANAAQKGVNDYTTYMQGEGSAGNQYHGELEKQLAALGYSPDAMTAARTNLNQAQGALGAYSDFANTAASKFGLNAGGFAAANAGALSGLNNNIATNQGVVSSLSDLYKTAQTGANQYTGGVIQGEQNTLAGLQDVFTNAANQRDQAATMMNFYADLARQQGGMNAQQAQYYAAAQQAYASATQAMAQAAVLKQQADMTRAYMASPAYQQELNPNSGTGKATGVGVIAPGHTAITGPNGSVVGVYQPPAQQPKPSTPSSIFGNLFRNFAAL